MTSLSNNELFNRFKQYSGLPDEDLELFRDVIIDTEYRNQISDTDDSDLDDFTVGLKHFNTDGSEYTLSDVPLISLVNAIEGCIQGHVPEPRRSEVYNMVVKGVHGIKQTPKWDRQKDNPRATPQTPFSESRAPLESRQTNMQLFESFASASKLDHKTLTRIRGMIVWRDSARSNGTWGAIDWDTFEVTGGRLGPTEKHTFLDVPHCYVRDRLMASTLVDVNQESGDLVRRVVFSDLNPSQIKQYAALIQEMGHQEEEHLPAKTKKPRSSQEVFDRAQIVREIQQSRKINLPEAESIMKQEELLDIIDDTISLAPSPRFTALKTKCSRRSKIFDFATKKRSVLIPGALVEKDDEVSVPGECTVDRDCDQIRAMIKVFVRRGGWTMEEFFGALEGPRRPEINRFLGMKGPLKGKQSMAFHESWYFFKRRELLGFSLTDKPKPKLSREVRELLNTREVDPNRGKKRPALDSSESQRKTQKTSKSSA